MGKGLMFVWSLNTNNLRVWFLDTVVFYHSSQLQGRSKGTRDEHFGRGKHDNLVAQFCQQCDQHLEICSGQASQTEEKSEPSKVPSTPAQRQGCIFHSMHNVFREFLGKPWRVIWPCFKTGTASKLFHGTIFNQKLQGKPRRKVTSARNE